VGEFYWCGNDDTSGSYHDRDIRRSSKLDPMGEWYCRSRHFVRLIPLRGQHENLVGPGDEDPALLCAIQLIRRDYPPEGV
jgi:hypothetical protein